MADVRYLEEVGFDVAGWISDCIDTSALYKAPSRDSRQCFFKKIAP